MQIGLAAALLGLIPVAAVLAGRPRGSAWYWLAAAFAVSFGADMAGSSGHALVASQVYPVTQSAIFALVLAPARVAVPVIGGIVAVAAGSAAWRDAAGLDFALHAAAWGSVAVIAWRELTPGALRTALLVGFGGGLVAWAGFVLTPGWWWWLAYQGTRAIAAGWFVVAVWQVRQTTSTEAGR